MQPEPTAQTLPPADGSSAVNTGGEPQRPSADSTSPAATTRSRRPIDYSRIGLPLVLVLLVGAFSLKSPSFFSQQNFVNTASLTFDVVLLAITQTALIAAGGIDLSIGAVVGLGSMGSALAIGALMDAGLPIPLAIVIGFLVALAIGALIGLVNAVFITYLKMPPFIITLGTSGIAGGAMLLSSNGIDVTNLPPQLGTFMNFPVLGWFTPPVIVTALFCAVFWIVMHRTRFGAHTFAIGDSAVASERAGIRVGRHLFSLYLLSSLTAALGGFMVMGHLVDGSASTGGADTLNTIAAVFVGGASLSGGRGSIGRTILGALIIGVLSTGLVIAGLPTFWQAIAVGAILVGAVYLDNRTARLAAKS